MKYLLFLLVFISSLSCARDHLEPEESIFSGGPFLENYDKLVTRYLWDSFHLDVKLRVIGIPSFSPEYALGIKEVDGDFKVFRISPEVQLWGYQTMAMMDNGSITKLGEDGEWGKDSEGLEELKKEYPKDPSSIPKNTCEESISKSIATDISFIWSEMLKGVRYPESSGQGPDGETYHFSMPVYGFVNHAGSTWSPNSGTKTYKLVNVAEKMADFCLNGGKNKYKKSLIAAVSSFKQELHSANK